MKYLILMLFLASCTGSPGKFTGTIVGLHYNLINRNNIVTVFTEKYGNVDIYDTPFYGSLQYNKKVTIACSRTEGFAAPNGCNIVGINND